MSSIYSPRLSNCNRETRKITVVTSKKAGQTLNVKISSQTPNIKSLGCGVSVLTLKRRNTLMIGAAVSKRKFLRKAGVCPRKAVSEPYLCSNRFKRRVEMVNLDRKECVK